MVIQQNVVPMQIHNHTSTRNKSFLDMHYFLQMKGINNNKFFLALYDADLARIDPRDPNLSTIWKQKVLRECQFNYWYFLREIVRIPDTGGAVNDGVMYKLDRGNLALNFGFTMNWNMFLELPRQFGKTTSALCWYLWVFNFGTTNSEVMFMNKKHEDSKMNLRRLKDIRKTMPPYLQMDALIDADGKKIKPKSNVETMDHILNGNKITTKPGANSRAKANGLGRGCTMPMQWYDEYAFILYNKIIYMSATPAFSTASKNAKRNGKPYGILITTTPGDLTTDEGENANNTRNSATPFYERYYDYSFNDLNELQQLNTKSTFFYIKFTYKQLGAGDEYFQKMVRELEQDYPTIRREVLLEWATMSNNSPFTQQDLEAVSALLSAPITSIPLGPNATSYTMEMYKQADIMKYPPIIGVDIAGGFTKDSSAITIIDSRTTDVIACFNCNYISPIDLAKCIYQIVVQYMPNAIVNIERNGGYGASVLAYLLKTKVKRNLYYEIKEKVIEERFNGMKMAKKTQKVKVYGFDETKNSRNLLMEILKDRMENHKKRFVSRIIYDELCTLEMKKGGRIEHSENAHDDQIFSMLMALYVWYEGKNLMENFGLQLREIKTDNENEEAFDLDLSQGYTDISRETQLSGASYDDENPVQQQLKYLNENRSISYEQWKEQEHIKNREAVNNMLKSKIGRQAYINKYHMDPDDVEAGSLITTIPDQAFSIYEDYERPLSEQEVLNQQFRNITNYR